MGNVTVKCDRCSKLVEGSSLMDAIPPAYTEFIGKYLMQELESTRRRLRG